MKTKQRIIEQAIALFNAKGLSNVTIRDIAKSMGISHGNLNYHFPNREILLISIYKLMTKDASKVYDRIVLSENPFLYFNELLQGLEIFHNKYKFFNLDVLEISRHYPKVSELLNTTFQIRKSQMRLFFQKGIEQGYFKDDNSEKYIRLQHTIRILITFWSSQKEILTSANASENSSMSVFIWDLLIPHMSKKGLQAYNKTVLFKNK